MRPWKVLAAIAILVLPAGLGSLAPRAEARPGFMLRRFLLGRHDGYGGRFIATGGRGATGAYRDNALLLVFTAPVDFDTVSARTVKIGIPTSPGLVLPAEGSFYRYAGRGFDPVSGSWVVSRVYRNRIVFDPRSPDGNMLCVNPEGFNAGSVYTVTVPGIDRGPIKTLETTDGRPNLVTFETTFATGETYMDPYSRD